VREAGLLLFAVWRAAARGEGLPLADAQVNWFVHTFANPSDSEDLRYASPGAMRLNLGFLAGQALAWTVVCALGMGGLKTMSMIHFLAKSLLVGLESSIFAATWRWRSSRPPVDMLFALLLMMSGAVEIVRFPRSRTAKMARQLLVPEERHPLKRPKRLSRLSRYWLVATLVAGQVAP
jgi:hypothetical protein